MQLSNHLISLGLFQIQSFLVHLDPEHGAGGDGAGLVGGGAHVVALVPRVDAVETHASVTDNLDPVRKSVPTLATPANLWSWITPDLKHEIHFNSEILKRIVNCILLTESVQYKSICKLY